MPNLDEFLNKVNLDTPVIDGSIEIIESIRPCSKCDLYVESYEFNNQSMEMYWKCKDGHETRHKVG
jgi:hypothetical protein